RYCHFLAPYTPCTKSAGDIAAAKALSSRILLACRSCETKSRRTFQSESAPPAQAFPQTTSPLSKLRSSKVALGAPPAPTQKLAEAAQSPARSCSSAPVPCSSLRSRCPAHSRYPSPAPARLSRTRPPRPSHTPRAEDTAPDPAAPSPLDFAPILNYGRQDAARAASPAAAPDPSTNQTVRTAA